MAALEVLSVKSRNFEFLRARHSELAALGGFAEAYAYPDPQSALAKLRTLAERMVEIVYEEARIPRPFRATFNDLLLETTFRRIVPQVVQTKLHMIREYGNKALHGNRAQTQDVLRCLRETFETAQWFHLAIVGGHASECGQYVAPVATVPDNASAARVEKEKKAIQEKLAAQDAQMQQLLTDLAAEQEKRVAVEKVMLKSREELDALLAKGEQAANVLDLDELTTRRRYIDAALIDAGWSVADGGKSTDQVGQEVALTGMPTTSGKGIADYVLWADDGKPLAVIEAKRAAEAMEKGRQQAKLYADCLEKKHGVRPVMFYTNGIDIGLWDDAGNGTPPRDVHGFYSKDSLEHLRFKRGAQAALTTVAPKTTIAGRMYQLETIKRVCERFADGHRKALIVQATGTGKTRVAISLCDVLSEANWAKRILFLCDRRELRKQAANAFKEFLPGATSLIVTAKMTAADRIKSRVFIATYNAMIDSYRQFDIGFFDLIIADESHRSIYNKFRDLFTYFDALQVGLTATPVKFIDRNTFSLFKCEGQNPTANFGLQEAIDHQPPYLVAPKVVLHTTRFLRDGIKYSEMTPEQRAQLEADEDHPEFIEFDASHVDKQIFNRDTTRKLLANLMDHGVRDATGMRPGKTIVFARNHAHAMHIEEVFNEVYPQYGGKMCRVIDNEEPRAEQLIDDFKDRDNELAVAISVDMLDTGIDVPECVNLVLAKPIRSYVKFWQMIGRGTRLCPNLFGPGKDKTEFLVFDHWGNFEFFSEKYVEKQPSVSRSLLQMLFEARIELARVALDKMDDGAFQAVVDLIVIDLRELDAMKSFAVKEHWKSLEKLKSRQLIEGFSAATRADLLLVAAPLMKERNIRGDEDAYRFDLLLTLLETEHLKQTARVQDYRARVEEAVELLPKNLSPVKAKKESIEEVRDKGFWKNATVPEFEELREDLRGIMKYQVIPSGGRVAPLNIDIEDREEKRESYIPKFDDLEMVAYRKRVEDVIAQHFAANPVLLRVRANKRVTDAELEALSLMILQVDDKANLKHLAANSPITRKSLFLTLRGIVGLDPTAVDVAFTGFVHRHPKLTSQQLRFLAMVKNLVSRNGGLEIDRLYDEPFTTLHPSGIDGIFTDVADVDELASILAQFTPSPESVRAS